jgi:hypothetical protein
MVWRVQANPEVLDPLEERAYTIFTFLLGAIFYSVSGVSRTTAGVVAAPLAAAAAVAPASPPLWLTVS